MKNSKTRGATKVPNVKLRPAQASSSRLNKDPTSLPRVSSRDNDAAQHEVDLNVGNKPFKNIVLCATGDLDKRTLFAHAHELGAIRANDFTDQVTHLVADGPGSAKYRCAVERRLPILKSSWVEEAYQTWLNGEIVALDQSVLDHRLPIFSGVKLCITGMDDLETRGRIHSLLARENGVYLKSLDKTATHLLCCASEESPKLKWANEYNKIQSKSGSIHLVWEEWFWDSLEFGGRWDEREYEVSKPRPSRKVAPQLIKDDLRRITPTASHPQHAPLPCSLPLSTLLGDDPPEHGNMNKVPQARKLFYSNIFQQREREKELQCSQVADTASGCAVTHKLSEPTEQHEGTNRAQDKTQAPRAAANNNLDTKSVLTRIANHRVTSFGTASQSQGRQPFQRIISSASMAISKDPQGSSRGNASTSGTEIISRLFVGYSFRAFGEAKCSNIRDALEAHGGRWISDEDDEEPDFLIVRLVSGGMYWRDERDEAERGKYRTECWLERCIFEERICSADEHVVFVPLKIDTPVAGSEQLSLSLSGLDTAEACWVKRLIRAIGGSLAPTFSRHSTHLVCPSQSGVKFDKAKEWGIDVVDTGWLIEIATTGEIPNSRQFMVSRGARNGLAKHVSLRQEVNGKGKEKEIRNDNEMIVDITNGASQESDPLHRDSPSLIPISDTLERQQVVTHDSSPTAPIDSNPIQAGTGGILHHESEFTMGNSTGLLSGGTTSCTAPPYAGKDMEIGAALPLPRSSPQVPVPSKRVEKTSQHLPTVEGEQSKQKTIIPSSHSPSPLRILPKRQPSVSSPPIGETRGLRTAITALLGKRGTEAREEADGLTQKRQVRSNKRPRPPSKAKSDLEPRRGPSPALAFSSGSPPFSRLPHFEDVDAIPEEGHTSLRVVYEDPGQRAEKKRLIALFEGQTATDVLTTGGKDHPKSGNDKYEPQSAVTHARPAPKRKLAKKSMRT